MYIKIQDVINSQRIVQTKATSAGCVIGSSSNSNFIGKPIVIVTKSPATSITTVSTSSSNNLGGSDKPATSQVNQLVILNSTNEYKN